jgi:hypothetical protein
MLPRWSFACAPVRAADRDGAEHYRPFDPRPHAPDWLAPRQSDHNPRTGSPRPCEQSIAQLLRRSVAGPGFDVPRDPSNLRAISLRYHARMVSGRAVVATSLRDLRPNRCPISPSFARSASESLRRPFNNQKDWKTVVKQFHFFDPTGGFVRGLRARETCRTKSSLSICFPGESAVLRALPV